MVSRNKLLKVSDEEKTIKASQMKKETKNHHKLSIINTSQKTME